MTFKLPPDQRTIFSNKQSDVYVLRKKTLSGCSSRESPPRRGGFLNPRAERLMGSLRNFSRVCFKGLSEAAFLEILPFSFQNQYRCCLSLDNLTEDLITQSTIFVNVFRRHEVQGAWSRSDLYMNILVLL